jgi:long-chain acyl-CoA synthetase
MSMTTTTTAPRAAARLAKHLETALGTVELSLPQYRLLAYLDGGEAAASVLAGDLAVTRPSITALVDGLVARSLIERRADDADRRRVTHLLTDAGRALLQQADEAINERLAAIAGPMTALEEWGTAMDVHRANREAATQ